MKAKGNNIPVTLSLTIRPAGFLQGRSSPRKVARVFALLPFAFCLLPS
jgi:hypothetical protein